MKKLDVVVDPNNQVLTSCIKFLANVLGENKFSLHDVDSWQSKERSKIHENARSNDTDIAELCCLPMLINDATDSPSICYAGLCTVARQMVHHSHACNETEKSISLLGYQETCLKAYAEVSNWTHFCESEFPNAVNSYCDNLLDKGHDENGSNKIKENFIPHVLLKLEKELSTPKNLPNKSKFIGKEKGKWLKILVSESFEGQKLQQDLKTYIQEFEDKLNRCRSWSPYLIGFQITVADLIILSMVAQLFQKLSTHGCLCALPKKLPLIFEWIEMMKILSSAKIFIQSNIEVLFYYNDHSSIPCTPWLTLQIFVDPVSQTKFEQKNKKIKVDHQSKISSTLEKIKSIGIDGTVLDLSDVQPSIDWESHSEYLNPFKGDLNVQRALRKQHQISNILTAVKPLVRPGCRIVDFCAGGGHVGIVLAYFLKDCEVVLVENKEESVKRAVKRIKQLELDNIKICHTNLDYFCGVFDVGVTLHACGVASDLVLNACYKMRASFVVCPCCYGSIMEIESVSYPRSQRFCDNISLEDYMILSHSSDMTSWDDNSVKCKSGRSSMASIDSDRCLYMEELGYETLLRVMVPKSCSPKNHLLIGTWKSS